MKQALFSIGLLFLTPGVATPAWATLGESASSVEAIQRSLQASRVVHARAKYTVHEISASGTQIKEFVTSDGKVFAVTWIGPLKPDLSALLGSYASDFEQASGIVPGQRGRRHWLARTSRISVSTVSKMRNMRGKVIALDLVPNGLDLQKEPLE